MQYSTIEAPQTQGASTTGTPTQESSAPKYPYPSAYPTDSDKPQSLGPSTTKILTSQDNQIRYPADSNASQTSGLSSAGTPAREDNQIIYPADISASGSSGLSAAKEPTPEDNPPIHLTHMDTSQASVQSPGSTFAANLPERGNKLREEGANILGDSSKIIDSASTSLAQQGEEVQKRVKGQQGRSVIGKVAEKVGKELHETFIGEPQQK